MSTWKFFGNYEMSISLQSEIENILASLTFRQLTMKIQYYGRAIIIIHNIQPNMFAQYYFSSKVVIYWKNDTKLERLFCLSNIGQIWVCIQSSCGNNRRGMDAILISNLGILQVLLETLNIRQQLAKMGSDVDQKVLISKTRYKNIE